MAALLAEHHVDNVFTVTGGAIAHFVDSLGERQKTHGDIRYTCVIHEQSGAMAAEVYSRLSGKVGAATATSGPGATNLITGICGCWFDSIPAIFITGQVNAKESVSAAAAPARQVGFQETDIVSIVKPITKYAVQVSDPSNIRYEMERALYIASDGRPGPVLVDVTGNVQSADIDPATLRSYDPKADTAQPDSRLPQKVSEVVELLARAKRPLILLGGGVRIAGAVAEARKIVDRLGIPFVVSWSGFDLIAHDHPLFAGHIGVYGSRSGNFAVQNCDVLLSVGSRVDTRQTGGRVGTFARGAKKIMVDIDQNEIQKGRGLTIDVGITADAKVFLQTLEKALPQNSISTPDWNKQVADWRGKYLYPEERESTVEKPMSAYACVKILSDALLPGEVIIASEGGNLVWTMQAMKIKEGQRLISTFGNSPMGYALPAAIGAALALPGKRIICTDGDGGLQVNIQEFQTIALYNLPIKLFILNNRSMGIIKQFQDLYFSSRYHATTPDHGYAAPDFCKIAEAYGITTMRAEALSEVSSVIKQALAAPGPVVCDIRINEAQKLNPKLEFGRAIEDLSPYMPREELKKNMFVPILPESETIPTATGWVTL